MEALLGGIAAATLGMIAALVSRGTPVWTLATLALAGFGLWRAGWRVRVDRAALAWGLSFLLLAALSLTWTPSSRAAATLAEIGYVALAVLVIGERIGRLEANEVQSVATLFALGFLAGTVGFVGEVGLDYPLHRWVNHMPAAAPIALSNVPKQATALLALLVWPAALIVQRRWGGPAAVALPIVVTAASLMQSGRSEILGALVGLGAFALAQATATATRRLLAAVLVIAFVGAVPIALVLDHTLHLEQANWLPTTARHRIEVWSLAAGRALDAPLFGLGLDASRALRAEGERRVYAVDDESLLPLHPHNAYLQIWLEMGAAGAALALALALRLLAATRVFGRDGESFALAAFATGLALVSTTYGIWQAWWMCGLAASGLALALASRVGTARVGTARAGTARAGPILVIKLGAFGDFFLAQSAFAAIRAHHPGERLVLLTIAQLAGLARMSGLFDEVWEDPRGRAPSTYLAIRRRLRQAGFARVYDLQGTNRTASYFWLLAPGPWPEWSGTARWASHANIDRDWHKTPVLERYARQLRPFAITLAPWPDLSWLEADVAHFGLSGDFALLVPGSSPRRPDKRWPAERFGELARRLAARGVRPVVLGTEVERECAATILAACPTALDLTGRTDIAEIGALARRAFAAVGNDTGPTHLIAAVGGPTVVLFSDASDPIHATGRHVLIHHRADFAAMDVEGVEEALARAREGA